MIMFKILSFLSFSSCILKLLEIKPDSCKLLKVSERKQGSEGKQQADQVMTKLAGWSVC